MFAELVVTTKPYLRTCTAVDPHWLVAAAPAHFRLEAAAPDALSNAATAAAGPEKGALGPGGRTLGWTPGGRTPKRPAQRNYMVN